jgi:hypothetical protein
MYKPFKIFSIISVVLTILFIVGFRLHINAFNSEVFYSIVSIYFLMTFVVFLILLFKDNKIIFAKNYALKNTLLYILTTPIPLIIAFVAPYYLRQMGDSLYLSRNVDDFNICETCIKEDEQVEIIYTSGGPSMNNNFDFYYHSIGIVSSTRDTFNILTTAKVYVTSNNNKRYFSTTMLKIIENLHSLDSNANINDLKLRDVKKVAIDEDDALSENYMHYKTVIGELVTMTDTK